MGSELVRYGGVGSSRLERRTAKEVAVVQARHRVACARDVARVELVAEVTERALVASAEVTMLEQALAGQSAAAAARGEQIANAATAALVGVVFRAGSTS